MNDYYLPTVFFTLFFVVDPLGLIPVFITYLSGYEGRKRYWIAIKATIISIIVSLFFILFSKYLLNFLGISSGSFLVAGGILLFLLSMEMLFGTPSRIKMHDINYSNKSAEVSEDVSVFPLAIPMLCGPGNIAALLMFSSEAWGNVHKMLTIIIASIIVFLIGMVVMFLSKFIASLIGVSGISIIQRLIGLILSAMSVQFFKNGLVALGLVK